MKRCSGCGNPVRKMVRAMVIKSDAAPRMGLVCKVCASCGVLVVPVTLRMLPAKPRKVPRQRAMPRLLANVELEREETTPATPEDWQAFKKGKLS